VAKVDGYVMSCAEAIVVTVDDGNVQRPASQSLPPKGDYFLDGVYTSSHLGCDAVSCVGASPRTIPLVEYEPVGDQERPGGKGKTSALKTVPLVGQIAVSLGYFTDPACTVGKQLTLEVVRSATDAGPEERDAAVAAACKAGARRCGFWSVQTCGADGRWVTTESCSKRSPCSNGACVPFDPPHGAPPSL